MGHLLHVVLHPGRLISGADLFDACAPRYSKDGVGIELVWRCGAELSRLAGPFTLTQRLFVACPLVETRLLLATHPLGLPQQSFLLFTGLLLAPVLVVLALSPQLFLLRP